MAYPIPHMVMLLRFSGNVKYLTVVFVIDLPRRCVYGCVKKRGQHEPHKQKEYKQITM